MGEAEVEASEVVKLVLQFLQESGLHATANTLTSETGIALNAVPEPANLRNWVETGRWDVVLPQLSSLALPKELMLELHEHMLIELAEVGELSSAKHLLQHSDTLHTLQEEQPERFARLQRLLDGCSEDGADVEYPGGMQREQRRRELADAIENEVTTAPSGRLLSLIGQALRWQRHCGYLPAGNEIDLLHGPKATGMKQETERPPERSVRTLRFDKQSRPECAMYSPDGTSLAIGTCDGFVELYGAASGRLRDDLPYQASGEFLAHDAGVLALAFSHDGELLLTGTSSGRLKAFRVSSGKCVRRFERAHRDGVSTVTFSPDAAHVLSASFDGTARVHGLRSGTVLREFRGHEAAVHGACYSGSGSRVVTACSDGSVHVWDAKSGERLHRCGAQTFSSVVSLSAFPKAPERVLVCTRSPTCYLLQMPRLGTTVTMNASRAPELVAAVASPRGSYVYCLASDGSLYAFQASSGEATQKITAHSTEVLGLCHHPQANLLATFASDGEMKLFTPS